MSCTFCHDEKGGSICSLCDNLFCKIHTLILEPEDNILCYDCVNYSKCSNCRDGTYLYIKRCKGCLDIVCKNCSVTFINNICQKCYTKNIEHMYYEEVLDNILLKSKIYEKALLNVVMKYLKKK
jgi:hypothetical protein